MGLAIVRAGVVAFIIEGFSSTIKQQTVQLNVQILFVLDNPQLI